jgi:hypothetical protein
MEGNLHVEEEQGVIPRATRKIFETFEKVPFAPSPFDRININISVTLYAFLHILTLARSIP